MTFVVGESVDEVLGPFVAHRRWVFAGATAVTLFALVLFLILARSLKDLEAVRRQLDAIFALSRTDSLPSIVSGASSMSVRHSST